MVVGVLRAELRLNGTRSLKDKRQIVKSLLDRVRHQFRVAAAEVENQDNIRRASLGFACVSGEARHVTQVLTRVVGAIEREAEAELIEHAIDLL